jgi:hypothetical protein
MALPARQPARLTVTVCAMAKRPAKRQGDGFRQYAVVGAEHRLLEIAGEAARIFAAFPELRDPGRGFMALGGAGSRKSGGRKTAGGPEPRKRRTMSAAARKKISQAQKARWARHRAGK